MKQTTKPVIRASKMTQQQLKLIAALTGETMQAVIARLVQAELTRLQQHEQKDR